MKHLTIKINVATLADKSVKTFNKALTAEKTKAKKAYAETMNSNVHALFDARVMGYTDKKKPKSTATAYDIIYDIVVVDGEEEKAKYSETGFIPMRSFIGKDKRENANAQLNTLSDASTGGGKIEDLTHAVRVYLNCLYLSEIAEKIENNDTHRIMKHAFSLDACGNGKASPGAISTAIERTACRLYKGMTYVDINALQAEIKAQAKADRDAEKAEAKAEADRVKAEAKAEADRVKAEAKAKAKNTGKKTA